jgi:hypothetical protein
MNVGDGRDRPCFGFVESGRDLPLHCKWLEVFKKRRQDIVLSPFFWCARQDAHLLKSCFYATL